MISQDLEDPPCNSLSRDTYTGGAKLTKRRGTCSVKQSKIEGISEQHSYPCNERCCIFSTKMKEKIKVNYLIIPPLSGN